MGSLPRALDPFSAFRQFIVYRLVPKASGKADKYPVDHRTGRVPEKGAGGAHDPGLWTDAETAIAAAKRLGAAHGVGFVFTTADPFWFLDIDNALTDGQWSPLAHELLAMFPGAAVEVSSSGTGLHVFGSGHVPPHGCACKRLGLEFYTERRFVALTGAHASGDASTQHPEAIASLVGKFFPPGVTGGNAEELTDEPVADWDGPVNDDDLVRLALGSRSAAAAFAGRATFRDLWERNVDVLAESYPSATPGEPYDASAADAALAQHLAFWTGNNGGRIVRLMKQSGLARDKYDREGYLEHFTVPKACARQTTWASGWSKPVPSFLPPGIVPAPQPEAAPTPAAPANVPGYIEPSSELVAGHQFMAADQQRRHFAGCVYVRDLNRVLTPDGAELDQARFRVMYGGYAFPIDAMNEKTTTNAWEAFTESRAVRFPRVAATCFRPELPAGAIVREEGVDLVNAYVPVETLSIGGNPAPFLGLMARLLPDDRDRRILLSYMAALVQFKGRKFQWWPVVQGTEGNGKTLLVSALAHAVGNRYTHCPNVAEIAKSGNKFNGWVRNRLFVGMEEVYVPARREFLEEFKTTVTNSRLPIEAKGVDQVMGDNRANGLMCTNHRDGVPVTIDTRRYAVFYTAQQSKADLERDGMGGGYFPDLYDWALGRNAYAHLGANYGLAVVNHYLKTYQIAEEFNPAGQCQRAPTTTSTGAAIAASLGGVEQEILEAIGQGLPGFAGGWVSSMMLDRLLEKMGAARRIPQTNRRALMQTLGYDWHPGLPEGRTNGVVMPDGGKPRLFVKHGHLAANLRGPAEIAKAYVDAQQQKAAEAAFGNRSSG